MDATKLRTLPTDYERITKSTLAPILTSITAGALASVAYAYQKIDDRPFYVTLGLSTAIALGYTICFWKPLKYEVSIGITLARHKGHYHEITPNLVLGMLPLENYGHADKLKDYTIYSILESFELNTPTLFSRPVKWSQKTHHLESPDFEPLSLPNLHIAADQINELITKGKKVYVHCKAGHGRSAMAVIAYLMKYQNYTFEDAHALVKGKRERINLNAPQRDRMRDFEISLIPDPKHVFEYKGRTCVIASGNTTDNLRPNIKHIVSISGYITDSKCSVDINLFAGALSEMQVQQAATQCKEAFDKNTVVYIYSQNSENATKVKTKFLEMISQTA